MRTACAPWVPALQRATHASGRDDGGRIARYDFIAVYILASKRNGTLYTGVTSDLIARISMHREGPSPRLHPEARLQAERWSRIAERMAEAARKLSEAPLDDPATAEVIRAELRERFRRLAACAQAHVAWQREREAHERQCAQARRTGAPLPPPLAAAPFTDNHLKQIAKAEV